MNLFKDVVYNVQNEVIPESRKKTTIDHNDYTMFVQTHLVIWLRVTILSNCSCQGVVWQWYFLCGDISNWRITIIEILIVINKCLRWRGMNIAKWYTNSVMRTWIYRCGALLAFQKNDSIQVNYYTDHADHVDSKDTSNEGMPTDGQSNL